MLMLDFFWIAEKLQVLYLNIYEFLQFSRASLLLFFLLKKVSSIQAQKKNAYCIFMNDCNWIVGGQWTIQFGRKLWLLESQRTTTTKNISW